MRKHKKDNFRKSRVPPDKLVAMVTPDNLDKKCLTGH